MSAAEALNPIYTAAVQFGMRGLRLLPVERHTRTAILSEWQVNATNDVSFIDKHWASGRNGIGLCCGPQPKGWNILLIDVDVQNGGDETLAALEAEYGKIDRSTLCFHRTPSGGVHLFFNVPPGMAVTGTDVLGPGIDARGGHEDNAGCGYGVLPPSEAPSKNPETMGEILPYGAGPGQGLLDRDPGPAPQWMLDKIVEFIKQSKGEVQASINRHPSNLHLGGEQGDDPWDWTRNNVVWEDKLLQHGWQQKGKMWSRPGKTPREGTGSYLHDDGRFTFWTQTDLPPSMMTLGHRNVDGSYSISLADFITAYEFGGDRTAFGRHVRLEMMPKADVPRGTSAIIDADEPDEDHPCSWSTPVNLAEVLAGTREVPKPTILVRTDGMALFYPGTINGIHGDSGLGKGWVALTAAAEQLREGNSVVYIDLEDTVESIVARLTVLGVPSEAITERFVYLHPSEETSRAGTDRLVCLVEMHHPSLVILDSLGEAFGLDSVNEDKDNEVGPWLRALPRRLAEAGPCVVTVDHATKAGDNPLHPSGSKRKRAAIGGASYLVEAVKPLVQGRGGAIRLTTAKDRNGNHQRGSVAADLVFSPSGPTDMLVRVFAPNSTEDQRSSQERHDEDVAGMMVEMFKVAKQRRTPFSKTELCDSTTGRSAVIKRDAFVRLAEQGHFIEVRKGRFKAVTS